MYYICKQIDSLSIEDLDTHLSKGWYRSMQELIRLQEYCENEYYWLRLDISKVSFNKSQKRVYKHRSKFNIQLDEWKINQEIETLWSNYRKCTNFNTSTTVAENLLGEKAEYNRFITKMITIRDGDKLIAVGYFDLGKSAVTSILHFYHPDYKKYSLGKLLLLLEIEYCKQNNFEFYYTGYISLIDTKFDYKLFCGKDATEAYLPKEDRWEFYLKLEQEGLMNRFDTYSFGYDKLTEEEEQYLIEQIELGSK